MTEPLPYQYIIIHFIGGLAVFLYGMKTMSSGMKKMSGERIRTLMSTLTTNRLFGMLSGAFATMVVQSSSTIIVMLVGLVQSRIMTYVQAMGVILGAEIGTTVNAQLIAFRLHDYALIIFAAGFLVHVTAKKPSYQNAGESLAGFGLLFFGMQLMSQSMAPLRGYSPFIELLDAFSEPLISVFVGMAFTAVIQSSSAFVGIVIVLAQQGVLSLEAAIPLMLGANIGTCITAALAAIGTHRAAKRVSLAQILFNLSCVSFFLCFIPETADVVRFFSPGPADGEVVSATAYIPRQIANTHTLYNVLMACVFLPLTPLFARLVLRILPDKPEETRLIPMVWHLKRSAVSTPLVALSYARAEVGRMNKILNRMLSAAIQPFFSKHPETDAVFPQLSLVDGIVMREEKIDYLESQVTTYLFQIMRQELNPRESAEVFSLLNIVKDQEALGDVIEERMLRLLQEKKNKRVGLSPEGEQEIRSLHAHVCSCMEQLTHAVETSDCTKAQAILQQIEDFHNLEIVTEHHHLERIQHRVSVSEASHTLHMELIDALKQIHFYCRAITKNMLEYRDEDTG